MIRDLLGRVDLPWAARIADLLDDADLRPALKALLDGDAWAADGDAVRARCAELAEHERAFELVGELDNYFPDDSGAAAPLMLNVVMYGPGEALFVPTGQIHAHISGFGVEVMAASDNVLRAGLTPKHIDQEALFASLIPHPEEPHLVFTGDEPLELPVEEFRVQRLEEGGSVDARGPKVLLALRGGAEVGGTSLRDGESVLLSDSVGLTVTAGAVCVVSVP